MKTGFIGLGNMGQGMADNLLKNGADLVVYTRTRSKIDAMAARGAARPVRLPRWRRSATWYWRVSTA